MNTRLRTYLVASLPGWLIAVALAWWVSTATGVWAPLPWLLVAAWIAKDLFFYPANRRFYGSRDPAPQIVGRRGEAASALEPDGFVRVHGELWQATARGGHIAKGTPVRVREVHNLRLVVEPDTPTPGPTDLPPADVER